MLETLQKYQQDITTAAHRCDNLSHSEAIPESSDSSMMSLASRVSSQLAGSITRLETYMGRLREALVQWESVDKAKQELCAWLGAKRAELSQIEDRPAKLHREAAKLELDHLQVKGHYQAFLLLNL